MNKARILVFALILQISSTKGLAVILSPEDAKKLHQTMDTLQKKYKFLGPIRFPANSLMAEVKSEGSVDGIPLLAGTDVRFVIDGSFEAGTLARDWEIFGIHCKGKTEFIILASNRLAECTLAKPQALTPVGHTKPLKCLGATGFSGDRQVHTFVLFESGVLNDQAIPAGSEVRLGYQGAFESLVLGANQKFEKPLPMTLAAKKPIRFSPEGKLINAYLGGRQKIGNYWAKDLEEIGFYDSGKLQHMHFADDATIKGHKVRKGGSVWFYESGALKSYLLRDNAELGGLECKGENSVDLYESGKLKSCRLAKPTVYQGVPFEQDVYIQLDEAGAPKT